MKVDADADITPALLRGLAGYVDAVARELGLPAEGTSFEISDTATAYLGLSVRWPARPGHDLMLNWSESTGWSIAVETRPMEQPLVVAEFGDDPLPSPRAVARFVTTALAGLGVTARFGIGRRAPSDRRVLAARLDQYIVD